MWDQVTRTLNRRADGPKPPAPKPAPKPIAPKAHAHRRDMRTDAGPKSRAY